MSATHEAPEHEPASGNPQGNSRGKQQSTPRVGVVVVAYRSDRVLGEMLASVPGASIPPVAVVVVDNLPGEGTTRELAEQHGAAYVAQPQNPGYGGGMNAGVSALPASVEWVLVCNPDLELLGGSIDALLAVAESDERIGSVGPAVLNSDHSVYPSARSVPSLRTGVGHALFVTVWQQNPWTAKYRHDADTGEQRDAGWLSGSCVLVRRSAFDELGGFDEGYFMYFEDVDLGYRLGKAGWRNVYAPQAQVIHIGAHSTTTESERMIRAHHASARRFLSRKYSAGWLFWLRWGLSAALRVREEWKVRRAR